MKKYPISKEFFPFSHIAPPIRSPKLAGFLGSLMRPPLFLGASSEVYVDKEYVESYDGEKVRLFIFTPKKLEGELPCLVYYHGGGFMFGAAGYHYKIAKKYATEVGCKVIFPEYRLAPKHRHPTPAEDCYAALCYAFDNADRLDIDPTSVAVGGDSAGGALAAAVCQMARDRGTASPCAQMLIYPVTDSRMDTASNRDFTDTPMWNSTLSKMMWQGYLPSGIVPDKSYASPAEAESFSGLPEAYVETAEFDCLRDEGIAYAHSLLESGVTVTLNETKGTMHGFDIVTTAPATVEAVSRRIEFLKKALHG